MSGQIQTWHTQEEPASIRATNLGYVQRIELAGLTKYLDCPGFHLRLLVCPGDFVTEETTIAEMWSASLADVDAVKALHEHVVIERERDIAQDPRFGVRQLADIALRALSPAVNDPTTGCSVLRICKRLLSTLFGVRHRQRAIVSREGRVASRFASRRFRSILRSLLRLATMRGETYGSFRPC
jgi:uncharacterized membrane protein